MERTHERTPDTVARAERLRRVRHIFQEEGWGSLELVDEWNGGELDELRSLLRPEEYETLLDQLRDLEDRG